MEESARNRKESIWNVCVLEVLYINIDLWRWVEQTDWMI